MELPIEYIENIKKRSCIHFIGGLIIRFVKYEYYYIIRLFLTIKHVKIGNGSIIPLNLALKINSNFTIGSHCNISNVKITSFSKKLNIGNYVIIGNESKLIMGSHNIHSTKWENIRKNEGLFIDDYVWLCPDCVISPACSYIGYGAVIAPNSCVVKDVPPMSIVGGNPARIIGKRNCVHTELIVESLNGTDFIQYLKAKTI